MPLLKNEDRQPVEALVADTSPEKEAQEGGLSVFYRSSSWRDNLYFYSDSDDTTKNNGAFLVAQELKDFLSPNKKTINTPITGIGKMLRLFYPYSIGSHSGSEELKAIALAKYIVLLQLLANPNNTMDPSNPKNTLLGDSFGSKKFNKEIINLTFSYGLSFARFQSDFEMQLRKIIFRSTNQKDEKDKQLELDDAKDKLNYYLNSNSYDKKDGNTQVELNQEKEAFSIQYDIHRDALDVAKDNPHIQAYTYLRDAYRAYSRNDFDKAASQYQAAEQLLLSFDDTHPLIKEDYHFRAEKAETYRTYCRTRYGYTHEPAQEPVVERSLTSAIASHFSNALKYISSDSENRYKMD